MLKLLKCWLGWDADSTPFDFGDLRQRHLPALQPMAHPRAPSKADLWPKSRTPEPWFAALDVFLYAAHFEEFGLVVNEAQAMGVPVLTSRRVGAAECLPENQREWLLEQPDFHAARFHTSTLDEILAARNGQPFLDPGPSVTDVATIATALQTVLSPSSSGTATATQPGAPDPAEVRT